MVRLCHKSQMKSKCHQHSQHRHAMRTGVCVTQLHGPDAPRGPLTASKVRRRGWRRRRVGGLARRVGGASARPACPRLRLRLRLRLRGAGAIRFRAAAARRAAPASPLAPGE